MVFRWEILKCVLALSALTAVASLLKHGFTEEYIRSMLRITARVSLVLFLLAFSASGLRQILDNRFTAWLANNRRYVGLSFAASHGIHLLFLGLLAACFPYPFLDELKLTVLAAGGLAYLFILAMAVTSFTAPRAWLGERYWKILHTVGSYYIWFIFAQSYTPLALEKPVFAPMAAALVIALLIRSITALRPANRTA